MKNILLILATLTLLGCKKTIIKVEQVPSKHSWLSDSSLTGYNKIILSSIKIDENTLAIFNKQELTYINVNQLSDGSRNSSRLGYGGSNYGSLIPLSISQRIGVFPTDLNNLRIFSIRNPLSNFGGFTFNPNYSNSQNSIKGFPLATEGGGYSILNDRYILAPVEINYVNNIAKCNLLRVDNVNGIAGSIQLGVSKDINLVPASSTIGFSSGGYYSFSFHDKFFLSLASQFFRIDTLGNVKAYGYGPLPIRNGAIRQLFSIGDNLFATTISDILISTDFGETWSVFISQPDPQYLIIKYLNVGNELYAYLDSQIWRVKLSGNSLSYQELDNDGLATNQITGVNKVGKYTFVSTLSGLYYRDTTSFNTPKK